MAVKAPRIFRRAVDRVRSWFGSSKRNLFKGAELSRLWFDWIAAPISADQELYQDFMRLRGRARDMRRNHPLVRQFIDMLSTNVIGPDGFKLRARVRTRNGKLDTATNQRIEDAFEDWSTNVTPDDQSLVDLQQLLIESVAIDGEGLIRKLPGYKGNPYRFALQLVDPDLLDHQFFRAPSDTENEVRLGVEVDKWGKAVGYWFWDRHPSDLINQPARRRYRVPAEQVIHIFRPDRVNQSRGITWLNSVMFPARMLDGYVEAEVVAARTGAAKMGFFETTSDTGYEPPKEGERISMEAQPGQFEQLPPGVSFKGWTPEHPSAAFPSFMVTIQRWIASGLRVAYNTLANDLNGVSYSSLRSSLQTERDQWRKLQKWWARRVLMPIYRDWLDFAQLSKKLYLDTRDFSAFLQVNFHGRGWGWVDPLKDVNSSIAAINNGLMSRARVLAEQGLDFEEVAEELKEEQDLIKSLGLDLTGLGVGAGQTAGDQPQDAQNDGAGDANAGRSEDDDETDRTLLVAARMAERIVKSLPPPTVVLSKGAVKRRITEFNDRGVPVEIIQTPIDEDAEQSRGLKRA